MPQSLSNVPLHITFSTRDHRPWIDEAIAPELWAYLTAVCRGCKCPSIRIGGYVDHVHILAPLARTVTIAELVEDVKKRSSHWIKTRGARYRDFYWQNGYAALAAIPEQVPHLVAYIDGQKEHHRQVTFKEEFRSWLDRYGIEFDERYVWD